MKNCRWAAPGALANNQLAYPMPMPEPSSPPFCDEDTVMHEVDEMFDNDLTLSREPMEEEFFNEEDAMDADKALVEPVSDAEGPVEEGDDEYVDAGDGDSEDMDTPKAVWSEETIQTEAMARLGICVNTTARVIVCIACASVVKPCELPRHLAKSHSPMSTTTAFSEELVKAHDLRADADSRPGSIIQAIYGLDLVDGFITCDTCGYACKSDTAKATHTRQSKTCKGFRERLVQTFRPSSKRMYFGVNLVPESADEPGATPLNIVAYLNKKFSPVPFSNLEIKSPKSPRDANHFLSIEKWDLYLEGKTGAQITQLLREREPEFRAIVRTCMDRFADNVVVKLVKADHEVRAAMGDYVG